MGVTKRDLKRLFGGDHRMSLLIDYIQNEFSQTPVVNQVAHGFAVGNAIRDTGSGYVKAIATSETNAATIGVVTRVIDANNFSYNNEGNIIDDQFVRGKTYYLSYTTAGKIEEIANWPEGTVKQLIGHCGDRGLELEIDAGYLVGESSSGGDIHSGSFILFEKELANNENDIDIGATLQNTFIVFHNGQPLFSNQWSGAGTSVLHLNFPTSQFDKLIVVSIYTGVFEKELDDDETDINVGFTIRSFSQVFFNGDILMTTEWSGVGTETLTLLFPVTKYDKVIMINR